MYVTIVLETIVVVPNVGAITMIVIVFHRTSRRHSPSRHCRRHSCILWLGIPSQVEPMLHPPSQIIEPNLSRSSHIYFFKIEFSSLSLLSSRLLFVSFQVPLRDFSALLPPLVNSE